ncbi:hypothetical protein RN001_014002 [Aquatica leii]|uniref:Uncharacterized protein n=1 Tax=Aquatica leii TaxID=1421715 RepID=A0AAN7PSG7_9COLE|nr:hypothetical protein RN001_014002 [Aquatica leii]
MLVMPLVPLNKSRRTTDHNDEPQSSTSKNVTSLPNANTQPQQSPDNMIQVDNTVKDTLLSENPVKENVLTSRAFETPDKKDRLGTFSGKCAYCRVKGHHINECNKKQKQLNKIKSRVQFYCATDVELLESFVPIVRTVAQKHPLKFFKPQQNQPSANFLSLQRPILPIQIWDSNGTAIADTGATGSVAGETYNFLKNRCCFTRQNFSVTLADGTDIPQEVLTTTVPIQIAHKAITVEMIVLPNAKSNRTLLGIDFLSKARVLLNTADQSWCFIENPEMPFPYATETRIDGSLVESSTSVDNVSFTSLREDEGIMLTSDQRRSFNSFLTEHEITFCPRGEPTDYAEHRIVIA